MDIVDGEGGIIYILSNEAMPNIIKIGRTSGDGVERRVTQLSQATGVPLPFTVLVARIVHDAMSVERALHLAFGPERINPAREFFSTDAYRAIALVNAFPGRDITPQTEKAVERAVEKLEPGSIAAANHYARKRRPPLNFLEMGIPIGSLLTHVGSKETAVIVEAKKVEFRGQIVSLTRALRLLSDADYDVQPSGFWLYNNEPLNLIYDRTYPRDTVES